MRQPLDSVALEGVEEFQRVGDGLWTALQGTPCSGLDVLSWWKQRRSRPERAACVGAFLSLWTSARAEAVEWLRQVAEGDERLASTAQFLSRLAQQVERELAQARRDSTFAQAWARLVQEWEKQRDREARRRLVWGVFFPEGVWCDRPTETVVEELRTRRTVRIRALNPRPLQDPIRELLFTGNVLLTLPFTKEQLERVPRDLRGGVEQAATEPQQFWYDHPIPIGIRHEANEVVYGLRALDAAVQYEKEVGLADPKAQATVVLSVSVTHRGLHTVAGPYLRRVLEETGPYPNLRVYAFTESDTARLLTLLTSLDSKQATEWREWIAPVFGVDGEYGRHYSFLKAIAAVWQVFMDPGLRATFKIDLDQVFPQKELVEQGGGTAFTHFRSPLWGATGVDAWGEPVYFGLLAGALVNEKDIHRGLFTPDVPMPDSIPDGEATVFFPRLPMAVSTLAEMMTRYGEGRWDGRTVCLQRIHVTGGTNGILIEALRKYRPFTPSWIGRAEDQAYLLSVLFEGEPRLRYVHSSGLIMRHDKEAFAQEAIYAAKAGRFVGDLLRTLYFSAYARGLPGGLQRVKEQIDPFTGAFASRIPWTICALRFSLACAERWIRGGAQAQQEADQILELVEQRLAGLLEQESTGEDWFWKPWHRERTGWNEFYDLLDRAETSLRQDKAEARRLQDEIQRWIESLRVI